MEERTLHTVKGMQTPLSIRIAMVTYNVRQLNTSGKIRVLESVRLPLRLCLGSGGSSQLDFEEYMIGPATFTPEL